MLRASPAVRLVGDTTGGGMGNPNPHASDPLPVLSVRLPLHAK